MRFNLVAVLVCSAVAMTGLLPRSKFVGGVGVSVRGGELVIFGEPVAQHGAEPFGVLNVR